MLVSGETTLIEMHLAVAPKESEENVQVLLISSIMGVSMAAGTPPVTKLVAFRRLVHSAAGARAEAGGGPKPGRSMR